MMEETTRAESLYEPITSGEAKGVEGFKPEDFRPCKGTVLIIVAPIIDKIGHIHLPDPAQIEPNYGRVASVPGKRIAHLEECSPETCPSWEDRDFDPLCPVKPGDWIVFAPSSGNSIPFAGRKDLRLISYTDDLTSEILGVFDGPPEGEDEGLGLSSWVRGDSKIFSSEEGKSGITCLNCGFFIPDSDLEKIKKAVESETCPECGASKKVDKDPEKE